MMPFLFVSIIIGDGNNSIVVGVVLMTLIVKKQSVQSKFTHNIPKYILKKKTRGKNHKEHKQHHWK